MIIIFIITTMNFKIVKLKRVTNESVEGDLSEDENEQKRIKK